MNKMRPDYNNIITQKFLMHFRYQYLSDFYDLGAIRYISSGSTKWHQNHKNPINIDIQNVIYQKRLCNDVIVRARHYAIAVQFCHDRTCLSFFWSFHLNLYAVFSYSVSLLSIQIMWSESTSGAILLPVIATTFITIFVLNMNIVFMWRYTKYVSFLEAWNTILFLGPIGDNRALKERWISVRWCSECMCILYSRILIKHICRDDKEFP